MSRLNEFLRCSKVTQIMLHFISKYFAAWVWWSACSKYKRLLGNMYSVYGSLCDVTNCCRKEGMENYTTLNVIKHAYKLNIKHIVDPTEVGNKCRVIFLNSLYHKVDLRQYHVNALKNCLGEALPWDLLQVRSNQDQKKVTYLSVRWYQMGQPL